MTDLPRRDAGDDPAGSDLAAEVEKATRAFEFADPDAGASTIDRWINRIFEVIGVSVLAAIVMLVFINAVGRYAIATPVIWAEELVIAMIPWLAMSGVFLSARRRNVIRLEYFTSRLKPSVAILVDALGALFSAAAFVHLAFYSFQYVSLFGKDATIYLKLPTGWFTSSMLIGSVAIALAFLAGLIRDFKARRQGEET